MCYHLGDNEDCAISNLRVKTPGIKIFLNRQITKNLCFVYLYSSIEHSNDESSWSLVTGGARRARIYEAARRRDVINLRRTASWWVFLARNSRGPRWKMTARRQLWIGPARRPAARRRGKPPRGARRRNQGPRRNSCGPAGHFSRVILFFFLVNGARIRVDIEKLYTKYVDVD